MPLYEFTCQTCNKVFSLFRKMNSEEPVKCPNCSSERVSRNYSGIHLHPGQKDRIRDVSWIDKDIQKTVKKSR